MQRMSQFRCCSIEICIVNVNAVAEPGVQFRPAKRLCGPTLSADGVIAGFRSVQMSFVTFRIASCGNACAVCPMYDNTTCMSPN